MTNKKQSLNNFFLNNKFIGSFKSLKDIEQINNNLEVCFIGRSNVGKSSAINALTKTKNLAKTSKTPGRTKAINIFSIYNIINLTDLPGYGYAKISKVLSSQLSKLIYNYFKYRINLIHTFVLIDTKVGIKNIDIDMFDLISKYEKKFSIILTKIDKCSKKHIINQKNSLESLMKNYKDLCCEIFTISSKNNEGIQDLQKYIFRISKIDEI